MNTIQHLNLRLFIEQLIFLIENKVINCLVNNIHVLIIKHGILGWKIKLIIKLN